MLGSSPHVRGTPNGEPVDYEAAGIIPACAGNTSLKSGLQWFPWDHPRMCGEHITYKLTGASSQGSSPHVRGTLPVYIPIGLLGGIIPACAGNTRANQRRL